MLSVAFCFLMGFQITFAEIYGSVEKKEAIPFSENYRTAFEEHSQNQTTEWQELKNPTFPLSVTNWELIANPSASDKSMDKMIVGRVKNNSKREFPKVRIEFIIYDEEGHQIAIVRSSFYDLKGQKSWAFKIPVTHDVEKASFNGLFVRSKEVK